MLVPCLVPVNRTSDFPVPAPLGSDELGLVLVLAAVAASVFLGRRSLPRPVGALVVVLGVVLVGTSVAVAQRELDEPAGRTAQFAEGARHDDRPMRPGQVFHGRCAGGHAYHPKPTLPPRGKFLES